MSINYAVTKKVDKSKGIAKERYYATTRALQKKPVNSVQIANQLAERSSLQNGDVLSALTQLSDIIAAHLIYLAFKIRTFFAFTDNSQFPFIRRKLEAIKSRN